MKNTLASEIRLRRDRAAFTLIEMLVVLVVIGVLVALVMPAITGAMQSGRASACVANLRQIGVALKVYTVEHNSVLPRTAWGSTMAATDGTTNFKWMDAIYPYAREAKLFVCPDDPGATYVPAADLAPGETSTQYGSYGLNGAYRNPGDGQTPPRSGPDEIRVSQLQDPGGTVWVADTANRQEANGSFGFTWADAASAPAISSPTGRPRQLDKIIERHRGRTNVLYCDGRVEMSRLDPLAQTRTIRDPVTGASVSVMPVFTIEREE